MRRNVLVIGADEEFGRSLELLVPGSRVRTARSAVDTEGLDVDVIVIARGHPLEELTEVRVHPRLYSLPVVLIAPGHVMRAEDWWPLGVWPITTTGGRAIEQLTDQVRLLLARADHPTAAHQPIGVGAARAS